MSALDLKIPPPAVGLITAALMYGVSALLPEAAYAHPLQAVLALLLALLGLATDVSALIAFHRHKTTINPLSPQRASSVVTSGIYRLTRNPMYLGMALLLLALALAFASRGALLMLPLVLVVIDRFVIAREERYLERLFGESYRRYLGQVRRWI